MRYILRRVAAAVRRVLCPVLRFSHATSAAVDRHIVLTACLAGISDIA